MEPFRVLSTSDLIKVSEKERDFLPRIGQILRAQVVERLAENRYFLRFGERLIMAEATIHLKEGEQIKARVEALRPRVILKLLPSEQKEEVVKPDILMAIAQKKDLASFFKEVLSWSDLPDLKEMILRLLADKDKLKDKVFWKNLAQMLLGKPEKGKEHSSLQKLLFSLLTKESERNEVIADFLNQFSILKTINAHLKQNGIYLQVPYWWQNVPQPIEIFIGEEKGEEKATEAKKIYFVHFRLELKALGKIEGCVRLLSNQDIYLLFQTEKEETAQLITSQISILEENLKQMNFQIKGFSCQKVNEDYWKRDFCFSWLKLEQDILDIKA